MKTIFELVKIVLDELYIETKKDFGEQSDEEIIKSINYLTDKYKKLQDVKNEPISYKSPATRFAYVYKYVAAHADYLYQVMSMLEKNKEFSEALSQESLRFTCIGGGPGSDIIGILKLLLPKKINSKIICYLCDQEQAWADSWTEINTHLPSEHISLSTNFQPLDILKPDTWIYQKKFLTADIFTLNFFVSEILRFDGSETKDFWYAVFDSAKAGAYFLYVDNGHSSFSNYFDTQYKPHKLELLSSSDSYTLTPSFSEQASALKEYIDKFSNYPKLKTDISFRLLIKT